MSLLPPRNPPERLVLLDGPAPVDNPMLPYAEESSKSSVKTEERGERNQGSGRVKRGEARKLAAGQGAADCTYC